MCAANTLIIKAPDPVPQWAPTCPRPGLPRLRPPRLPESRRKGQRLPRTSHDRRHPAPFRRLPWSECLASLCELAATGPENAVLHIIRLNDRPKSIKDLARLTNRDDVPNIQYSLRKLTGAGLALRKGAGRSGVTCEVTGTGRRVTENYGALRRRLLPQAVANVPGFSNRLARATRNLNLLSGMSEEISRVAATHRRA